MDYDQCRNDDVWSWFICLVDLTMCGLPWDGEKGPKEQVNFFRFEFKLAFCENKTEKIS